ncbi:hypothetical protein C8J56DRAFT_1159888 [Mycena floridula]|nr:hypothetical protein C8J56DRAFT_1159888 [Mycena floridula]
MAPCNAACKHCCTLKSASPALFQSLTATRRDKLMSLFRHNASALDEISDSSVVSTVEEDLAQCLAGIRHCEREKMRLDGMLLSLRNQKRSLEGLKGDCRGLLAPIRRIPPEILRSIFIFVRPLVRIAEDRTINKVDAFRLAAVSHHWRQIALSTRELWDDIGIIAGKLVQPSQLELLVTTLRYSGQLPLTMAVSGVNDAITIAVSPYAHRFSRLTLKSPSSKLLALSFPNVRHLHLSANSLTKLVHLESVINLGTLCLRGMSSQEKWNRWYNPQLPTIPTLTNITLVQIPLNISLSFISHHPGLVSATIQSCSIISHPSFQDSAPTLIMPFTDFTIQNSTLPVMEAIMLKIDAPKLKSLTVDTINHPSASTFAPSDFGITSMLRRTNTKLQSLSLGGSHFASNMLIQLLDNIPSLEHLRLFGILGASPVLSDAVLDRMNADLQPYSSTRSSLLVPNLVELDLSLQVSLFSTRAFVNMVKSRWLVAATPSSDRSMNGLQRVHGLFRGSVIDQTALGPLRVLKSAGMDLVLSLSGKSISLDIEDMEDSDDTSNPFHRYPELMTFIDETWKDLDETFTTLD